MALPFELTISAQYVLLQSQNPCGAGCILPYGAIASGGANPAPSVIVAY